MKKIYIMMMLVLTGMMAVAQTSVWNGGRTLWNRGAGTESDPFLLESAEHLAYLAYVVNKGYNTEGIYFKLTTDIDLNGSEEQQWMPIGMGDRWYNDDDGCERGWYGTINHSKPVFKGHFDGCEHSIINIYIDNSNGRYGPGTGLFGTVEGKREGEEVEPAVIENLFLVSGTITGNTCGGIVGNGSNTTLVSHCGNSAAIERWGDYSSIEGVGGIVGMNPYQVKNCYNKGDISGCNAGGIVGIGGIREMGVCEIMECYNEGAVSGIYAGGIIGATQIPRKNHHVTIDRCYNTGDINADGSGLNYIDIGPAACGIAGYLYSTDGAVTNCYHAGTVSSSKDSDCVLLYSSSSDTLILQNNFYINTCGEGQGEALTEEYMRSQEFVDFLNSLDTGQTWTLDTFNLNNGFPILAEDLCAVEVMASPSEGGTVHGEGVYLYGTPVTLTAAANEGYTFINWTKDGEEVSSYPTCSFNVAESGTYVANFSLNSYEVVVTAEPEEYGTATGSGTYSHGSTVTVTAVPNTDYHLEHWTKDGDVVSDSLSYSFVVTEDCQLVAHLEYNEGVDEVNASALKIYPNPTHGQFTVEGSGVVLVSDLLGQTILTREIDGKTMVELPHGVYFVTLDGVTQKVVVE